MSVGGKVTPDSRIRVVHETPRLEVYGLGLSTSTSAMLLYIHGCAMGRDYELYLRGSCLIRAVERIVDPLDPFSKQLVVRALAEAAKFGQLQPRGPQAWAVSLTRCFRTEPRVLPSRAWIIERDRNRCFYCWDDFTAEPHLDHVYPKSRGGWDDAANVVAACARCNLRKGPRTPEEWMAADPRWQEDR